MGRRTTAVTVDMTHGKKAMATRAMPKPASPITRLAAKTTRAPMAQATVTEAFSSTLSERSIAVRTETGARARPAFRVCYSASPMLEQHLPRWLRWAEDPEQARRAPFLARAPLFAGLPRRLLGRLAPRFFEKTYHAGEIVFHEGDPGRALFVVLEGAVEIIQISAQGEYLLRTLGPGDAFGELALIDDFPRSASARVAATARLLILYKTDFDALMDGNAQITNVVMRNLAHLLAVYARRTPVVVTDSGSHTGTGGPE